MQVPPGILSVCLFCGFSVFYRYYRPSLCFPLCGSNVDYPRMRMKFVCTDSCSTYDECANVERARDLVLSLTLESAAEPRVLARRIVKVFYPLVAFRSEIRIFLKVWLKARICNDDLRRPMRFLPRGSDPPITTLAARRAIVREELTKLIRRSTLWGITPDDMASLLYDAWVVVHGMGV